MSKIKLNFGDRLFRKLTVIRLPFIKCWAPFIPQSSNLLIPNLMFYYWSDIELRSFVMRHIHKSEHSRGSEIDRVCAVRWDHNSLVCWCAEFVRFRHNKIFSHKLFRIC